MASIHDLCNPEPEEDRPYRPGNKPEQPPSSVPYHPEGMQPHPSRHYSEYSEHSESGTHFNHHSHDRHPRHHPQHYHPYHSSQHKHHHQSNPDEQRYGHSSHNERWTYESKHPYDSQPNGPSHSYDHPMSYQEESKSHFREHTNSTSSGRSIGQDSATTSSIEGSSGNAQNHSIKSEHAHQNAVRSAGLRPDERPARIKIVQQPLHARMCGFGEKDRRPIDPPPIVQLLLDEDHDQHPSKQAQRSVASGKSSSVSSSSRPKRKSGSNEHGHEADDDNHADNEDAELDDGEDESADTHTTGRHIGARGKDGSLRRDSESSNPAGSKSSPSLGKRGRPSVSQKSGGAKAKRSGSDDDDSDHSNSESDNDDQDHGQHHAGEGQDPLFVLHVSLWSADGKEVRNMIATPGQSDPPKLTRILMGSLVVSPVLLNNVEGVPGWYFSFPDLSIRTEGVYTLKFSLMRFGSFDFTDSDDGHASTIISEEVSEPFTVFSAKKFPGMTESTELSKTFAKQGLKIPIRNDLRVRKVDRE